MDYTNWKHVPCHRCNGHGICMPYENVADCFECGGSGQLWIHRCGMVTVYPGGPARGSWKSEAERLFI